jgi:hypothetical protein
MAQKRGLAFYPISSVTGYGIERLKRAMADAIRRPAEQAPDHRTKD